MAGEQNSRRRPRLLFVVTEDWYFRSHRQDLARSALAAGYQVLLACRYSSHREALERLGLQCISLDFPRGGRHPLGDLRALGRLLRIWREHQPDLVHAVALKPVMICAMAACLRSPPAICFAVTGLGHLFISTTLRARFLRWIVTGLLARAIARGPARLVLQNTDDEKSFDAIRTRCPGAISIIRGAGVDTTRFAAMPLPTGAPPLVVLPARLLREKGVLEFAAAASALRRRGSRARFVLVGGLDDGNPSSLARKEVDALCRHHDLEWWGHRDDMPQVFAQASVVCLPSYREGLPKALLEAGATGRPLIATDVPGCREICRNDVTGLLVPPRSVGPLADAIDTLLTDRARSERLGMAARRLVETEFSVEEVTRATLGVYTQLLHAGSAA